MAIDKNCYSTYYKKLYITFSLMMALMSSGVVYSYPFTLCATNKLGIKAISISPSSPKKNQQMSINITGTSNVQSNGGTIKLQATALGLPVADNQWSLQSLTVGQSYSINLQLTPKNAGAVNMSINVIDSKGVLSCLKLTMNVSN